MFILGLILFLIGALLAGRLVAWLGIVLMLLGALVDIAHFFAHGVALIF